MAIVRERVTESAHRVSTVAHDARKRSRAVDAAFLTYERDRRSVGNVLAGAVAFRLFIYLLPLVLVSISILGVLVSFDKNNPEELGQNLGASEYLVRSIGTAADQSHKSLWLLIPIALFAVLTAGVATAKVIRAATALAWDQPITRMKHPAAGAAIAFACAFVAVVIVAADNALSDGPAPLSLATSLGAGVLFFMMWLAISMLLPHREVHWTALIPGALVVAAGVEALHLIGVYWLGARIESSSELYGPLGAGAALLGFLYLLGRLLVAGAMLNATLYDLRAAPQRPLARDHDL